MVESHAGETIKTVHHTIRIGSNTVEKLFMMIMIQMKQNWMMIIVIIIAMEIQNSSGGEPICQMEFCFKNFMAL